MRLVSRLNCLVVLTVLVIACAETPSATTPNPTAPSALQLTLTPSATLAPRVEIAPSRALVDQPVAIRVLGLRPAQPVTLWLRTRDDVSVAWEARATFAADPSGRVDLNTQPPLTGTYAGVDPMGLFWSLDLAPGERGGRFVKTGLTPTFFTLSAEADGPPIAATSLTRLYVAPEVDQITVREQGLAGLWFKPTSAGRSPAVLVVGGSEGGIGFARHLAALLASHGFAALALAYFNYLDLPAELANIPLEYFETALRWLQGRQDVRAEHIAVVGVSRGGELALLLGATFPAIQAVVAYLPSDTIYAGYGQTARGQPAWTYRGSALTPGTPIAVENMRGPLLLISGQADQVWPSTRMAERVMQRLAEHHFPYASTHLSYPGAGHTAGLPYVPTTGVTRVLLHPLTGEPSRAGGNPRDNAYLLADSWPKVLTFLEESLR